MWKINKKILRTLPLPGDFMILLLYIFFVFFIIYLFIQKNFIIHNTFFDMFFKLNLLYDHYFSIEYSRKDAFIIELIKIY